jgi:adenosylcobinamide-phosphate synthase
MFMSFSEQYFGDQILHWILALAFIIDALVGDPQWLYRYVPHPVAILGELIGRLDLALNSPKSADLSRRYAGALMVLGLVGSGAAIGWLLGWGLRMVSFEWAWIGEAIVVAVLIANRDLYGHVRRVATGLDENLDAGRCAVGHIVGRDPQSLDEAGVARAAIESTAENFSDGVVAPVFFYVVFGLPGILAYKTINTLDSMVGYRNERYEAFGWAAARLDDLANFLPARLAGIIFVLSAFILPNASGRAALVAMRRGAWLVLGGSACLWRASCGRFLDGRGPAGRRWTRYSRRTTPIRGRRYPHIRIGISDPAHLKNPRRNRDTIEVEMGLAVDSQSVESVFNLLLVANAALWPGLELREEPVAEIVIGE